MARAIWSGTISFGLLQVPVQLVSGEKKAEEIHFRMLDSRNKKPVKYQRVNAESGEEVPWGDIVKAYEYSKGQFVVIDDEDIKKAAPHNGETVEIESFVKAEEIPVTYYERPYYLVPPKKGAKGYVLLRETLKDSGYAGIARVVIRTKQYLAAVLPSGDALLLNLLRFPHEMANPKDLDLPEGGAAEHRISPKETEMARMLIDSMVAPWKPSQYHDDYQERLGEVINRKLSKKGVSREEASAEPEAKATNVVDFMAVLQKSLEGKRRTPAARAASGPRRRKLAARRAVRRRSR
jgi:DNA end-binding protein Ku